MAWGLDPLTEAAMLGSPEKIRQLIVSGTTVNGEKAGMALHSAAFMGKHEVIEVLLANGADVNAKNPTNGYTPLHQAVSAIFDYPGPKDGSIPSMDPVIAENKNKFAKILVARGADVHAKSQSGETPLHLAGSRALVELLLAHGAKIEAQNKGGGTPLYGIGSKEVAEALIAGGANVNSKNGSGDTPLHFAVSTNNLEIAKLLIIHGANVDTPFPEGDTPINRAMSGNKTQLASLLLARGAKLDVNPPSQLSELHWAAGEGNRELVTKLLQHGARVNAKDQAGETPLRFAVRRGHYDIAKELIANGADVNATSSSGYPLTHAIRDRDMLQLLLKSGTNTAVKDRNGTTLLGSLTDSKTLTALVLSLGADVDVKNDLGNTALHIAVAKGQHDVVKILLAYRANPNARNDQGQTPLFDAIHLQEKLTDPWWRDHLNSRTPRAPAVMALAGLPKKLIGSKTAAPATAELKPTLEIIKLLLTHGADVNAENKNGETPLYFAKSANIASLLLASGAKQSAVASQGNSICTVKGRC